MLLILKNISDVEKSYLSGSVIVPPGGETQPRADIIANLSIDPGLVLDVRLRQVLISDGVIDYSEGSAETLLERYSSFTQKDSENAPIQRLKMAPSGWSYCLRGIELDTCTVAGVQSMDVNGLQHSDCTLSFFSANGDQLTTQADIDSLCVQTVLDWEPPYDYELIGGTARVLTPPTTPLRVWCLAVPDVPYADGGSRVMIDGINFQFIGPGDSIEADGRVSKLLPYTPYHTNKMRFILRHPAGAKHQIHLMLEYYTS